LSQGSDGRNGQQVYTAANGTVVTTSCPVLSNANSYFIPYVFQSDLSNAENSGRYVLLSGSGAQTMDIALDRKYEVTKIIVYPKARLDTSTQYKLQVGINKQSLTNLTANFVAAPISFTEFHQYEVNKEIQHIHFDFIPQNWGPCLNRIHIYFNKYYDNTTLELSEDFAKLFNNPKHSDIQFLFDNGMKIYSHKCILHSRTPVDTFFQKDIFMNSNGTVDLGNENFEAFSAALYYMYTGYLEVSIEDPTIVIVSSMAEKFSLTKLQKLICSIIDRFFTDENVGLMLITAYAYKTEGIKQKVIDYVLERKLNTTQAFEELIDQANPKLAITIWKDIAKRVRK
jgi:hypothetical protein